MADAWGVTIRLMIRRFLVMILTVAMVTFGLGMLSPVTVSAVDECQGSFLTFRPWYFGLMEKEDGKCKIKTPRGEAAITVFVWAIILNILSILFNLVGYLALGFIIYGGYSYVLARGDPSKIAKGKKTVVSAIAGLVICILASLIVNTIVSIITGAAGA